MERFAALTNISGSVRFPIRIPYGVVRLMRRPLALSWGSDVLLPG